MGMQFLSVSDRNKPGVTSQKPVEFIQQKTLLALVSSLGIYQRGRALILVLLKDRRGAPACCYHVILGGLCFLTDDYSKVLDMFLNHTPLEV